jgi:MGT family glycosyltransferase
MSRFLFLVPPFYGHVSPALNVVKGLAERGEKVIFYTGSQYRDEVEAAGATFRDVPKPQEIQGDFLQEPALDMVFQVLQATVDPARDERPDCVIYDPMNLPGLLLARILGVPAARLHVQLPINEGHHPFDTFSPIFPVRDRFDSFDRDMEKLCDYYQMPAMKYRETVFHAEPLNIVPFPKAFVPAAQCFDERFHFVGPLFDMPPENDDPITPIEPLLYVSLGTVRGNLISFYDMCITAFGNQSRRVVISTGDEVDHSLFGPIPERVSLYSRVQQIEVLRQTSAFINHAGLNSVMEALYFGVPMVVVPIILEQHIVAERMAELQLGLVVDLQEATSHVLREAVERLEADQEIRCAVGQMQKLIREAGGHRQAVDLLVQYVS